MSSEATEPGRQVTVRHEHPVALADMQIMAKAIAESGMFGIKSEAQAMALMLLCQAEGIHPVMALRRYHLIEGKPAYRADALQGEFEREGAILWHVRDDTECSATFWRNKHAMLKDSTSAVKGAVARYKKLKANQDASELQLPGEITIIRTFKDAVEKRVACSWDTEKGDWKLKKNWRQSPRQMLHARCLTEGVRAMNPGLVAGIYTEDEIHDFEPENGDQRPQAEIIERNVREATANATGETFTETDGKAITLETPDGITYEAHEVNDYGPINVTERNYKDRVAHFGKPGGNMLGKKVGELPKEVVEWLYNKWIPKLSPLSSEDDIRLKKAIEFAHSLGGGDQKPDGVKSAHTETHGVETEAASQDRAATQDQSPSAQDIGAKAAAISDLRQRIDGMVLTEEQAVSYLIKYIYHDMPGVDQWKSLDDMPLNVLLDICIPVNWNMFKAKYEQESKPAPEKSKPARKRARRK